MEYQSPSALPLLAQVLIRIVAIKDYLSLRWKCSYSMGMGLGDDTYPDNGNRLCRRVSCDMPSLPRAIVSNDGLLNHILFITKGKEIILCVEGTDALHQRAVTEENGFIPIIVGTSLLAYFLSVLCPCLVNG